MVWCNHSGKNVPGIRPYDGALACNLCGKILEDFNFSTEVTFVKNAAGDKIRPDKEKEMRRRKKDSEKRVKIVEKKEIVWCDHCGKYVLGNRPYFSLACNLCGRILENFNFSTEVTFVKNAPGHSQGSGNIMRRSVQSGIRSSRERRITKARDEFNLVNNVSDTELDWVFVNEEDEKLEPTPATAVEAVRRTFANLLKKCIVNDISIKHCSKKSKTETGMEEKKEVKSNKHENGENEDNDE